MNEAAGRAVKSLDFAKFKDLTRNQRDLGATFEEMGRLLEKCHLNSKLQFRITDGDQVHHYHISLANGASKVQSERSPNPDFEVLTSADTWWKIASGALAPLEALGQGLLRFRGDTRLGQRILSHLAGTEGRTQIC